MRPAFATETGMTEREFMELPESMDKIELLDGEMIVSPSPTLRHQRIVATLFDALRGWTAEHGPAEALMSPLDIRFGPDRILQPDLLVFLGGLPADPPMPLTTVPDIAIEVMSSKRAWDRYVKRSVYLEAGVREVWVVDAENRAVEVYGRGDGMLVFTDTLTSPHLPGFALEVAGIFPA